MRPFSKPKKLSLVYVHTYQHRCPHCSMFPTLSQSLHRQRPLVEGEGCHKPDYGPEFQQLDHNCQQKYNWTRSPKKTSNHWLIERQTHKYITKQFLVILYCSVIILKWIGRTLDIPSLFCALFRGSGGPPALQQLVRHFPHPSRFFRPPICPMPIRCFTLLVKPTYRLTTKVSSPSWMRSCVLGIWCLCLRCHCMGLVDLLWLGTALLKSVYIPSLLYGMYNC